MLRGTTKAILPGAGRRPIQDGIDVEGLGRVGEGDRAGQGGDEAPADADDQVVVVERAPVVELERVRSGVD